MYLFTKYFLISAVLITFHSCSTVPVNLSTAKDEVIRYHESGKYDKETNEIVEKAINEFKNVAVKNNSTVVFDIDETALSNFEYHQKYDFGYVPELWDEWINAAKAPAMKEVKNLYDFLISRGFKVVFITGRKDYHYKPTFRNLINAGYTKFDTLIVRTASEYGTPAGEYKSEKRKEIVLQGYDIVGDVGDQWSDLTGPFHGIQIKLPNYLYIIK